LEVALHHQTLTNKKLGEILIEAGYVNSDQIEYGLRLQKMLQKAVLVAILSLGMSTVIPIVDDAYAANVEPCTFSEQLKSSPMRERYVANIATDTGTLLAHNTVTDDQVQSDVSSGSFFGVNFSSSIDTFVSSNRDISSSKKEGTIDSYSKDCLSCHDGHLARNRKV
jgi:hypothetical protein